MGLHAARRKMGKKILAVVASVAILGGAGIASTAAFAATGTGVGVGFIWDGDGDTFLGSYDFDDGNRGLCLDSSQDAPISTSYTNQDLSSFQKQDGNFLSPEDIARLRYIGDNYGSSSDPTTAAAAQLAVWRITGMNGNSDHYYAQRANGSEGAVIATADAINAAANANAAYGATANVVINFDDPEGLTATAYSDINVTYVSGGTSAVADGTQSGTLVLTDGVFEDNGTNTHAITNGTEYTIIPSRLGSTVQVSAVVTYSNVPYGNTMRVGIPDSDPDAQRMLFSGGGTVTALGGAGVSPALASETPFQVSISTQTSAATAEVGDVVTDEVMVTVDADAQNPNAEWGVWDNNGVLTPIEVTIHAIFWQDTTGSPIVQSATIPNTAIEVCDVTLVVTSAGTYTTPDCIVETGAYHVWTESINPADTPVSEGGDKILPFQSEYGISTESTFVPFPPTISTKTTHPEAHPNDCISDVMTITNNNTAAEPYIIKSTLIGPSATKPEVGDVLPDLDDVKVVGTVQTEIDGNGVYTTPCIGVTAVGYYFWVLESEGSDDTIIPAFTDYEIYDTEMSLVSVVKTNLANTGSVGSGNSNIWLVAGGLFVFGFGILLFIRPRNKKAYVA